jgi:hypothetical protein
MQIAPENFLERERHSSGRNGRPAAGPGGAAGVHPDRAGMSGRRPARYTRTNGEASAGEEGRWGIEVDARLTLGVRVHELRVTIVQK